MFVGREWGMGDVGPALRYDHGERGWHIGYRTQAARGVAGLWRARESTLLLEHHRGVQGHETCLVKVDDAL